MLCLLCQKAKNMGHLIRIILTDNGLPTKLPKLSK